MDAPALTTREAPLRRWADKVVEDPNGTSPAQVDALRAKGLSEREIFEATVCVAFRLAFCHRVNDALGGAPGLRTRRSGTAGGARAGDLWSTAFRLK